MRALLISTLVVIILITSWIIIYNFIAQSIDNLNSTLTELEDKVNNENWDSSVSLYKKVYKEWGNTKEVLMLILDHEEMEKVNLTLKKINKYISIKNKPLCLGETASLKYLLEHIKEKESLSLHNIF